MSAQPPEALTGLWDHLGAAQLALDTATATDSPFDDRFEAVIVAIANLAQAVRDLARHGRSSYP